MGPERQPAGDDPFETAFTVSGEGDHLVEYRSTDNAGNIETTKSVDFSIAPRDPEAPTAQAFADPSSGPAPLVVQFSATGLDPQGGELMYEWDFGDDSGSFEQSPRHTYSEPGTYTATVTVTDPQGKTGTDTVEIVVEDGNQAPVVRATSVPGRGDAPLTVAFSARATDDGPASELTYLWDFDDGGATAFGSDAEHTYRAPGTYTATVTVTDRGGKVGTAEVAVVVGDPSGPRRWRRRRLRCPAWRPWRCGSPRSPAIRRATRSRRCGTSATASRRAVRRSPTSTGRRALTRRR